MPRPAQVSHVLEIISQFCSTCTDYAVRRELGEHAPSQWRAVSQQQAMHRAHSLGLGLLLDAVLCVAVASRRPAEGVDGHPDWSSFPLGALISQLY